METSEVLRRIGIRPDEPVLLITAEDALDNILISVKIFCPTLKVDEMSKEDIASLLHSYSQSILDYHPEDYHQERAALLENFDQLKHYGLKDADYESIDFY
ncbi:MAG: hypothetical protein ABIH70_07495 [Chloroflexota bacterium]